MQLRKANWYWLGETLVEPRQGSLWQIDLDWELAPLATRSASDVPCSPVYSTGHNDVDPTLSEPYLVTDRFVGLIRAESGTVAHIRFLPIAGFGGRFSLMEVTVIDELDPFSDESLGVSTAGVASNPRVRRGFQSSELILKSRLDRRTLVSSRLIKLCADQGMVIGVHVYPLEDED